MTLKNCMIQKNESSLYACNGAVIKFSAHILLNAIIGMVPYMHAMEQALPVNGIENESFLSIGTIVLPISHLREALDVQGEDLERLEIIVGRLYPALVELLSKTFASYYVSKHDANDLTKMKSIFESCLKTIKSDPTFDQDRVFDLLFVMWGLKAPEFIITSIIDIQTYPVAPPIDYDALIARGWSEQLIDFYIAKRLTLDEQRSNIKALKDEIRRLRFCLRSCESQPAFFSISPALFYRSELPAHLALDEDDKSGNWLYRAVKWLVTQSVQEVPPLERCFHLRTEDNQRYVFLREHLIDEVLDNNPATEAAPYQVGLSLQSVSPLLQALREYHVLTMLDKKSDDQQSYFLRKHPLVFRYLLNAHGNVPQRVFLAIFKLGAIAELAQGINLSTAAIAHLLHVQSQVNAENIMQLIARQMPQLTDKSLIAVATFFATPWNVRLRRNPSRNTGFFD